MTKREEQILMAIISEFMKSAEPVGSAVVSDKYHVKASPATIRNEMSRLGEMGYLQKEHFSAGRLPTALGIRYFLERLMKEKDLDYMQEVTIKQMLHESRFERDKLLRRAVSWTAETLNCAALALMSDSVILAGIPEVLDYQEFQDIQTLKDILSIVENVEILRDILARGARDREVKVIIGEESGFRTFHSCAIVFGNFKLHRGEIGALGVLGPSRMNYPKVLPTVRSVAQMLTSVTIGW